MDITLEMIDELRNRTGASYREACEALEKAGGSLAEALVYVEKKRDTREAVKKAMREGYERWKDSRLEVKVGESSLADIPLTWGALGVAFFPKWAAWGLVGLMLSRGTIKIRNGKKESKDTGEGKTW